MSDPNKADLSELVQETVSSALQSFLDPLAAKLENMDIKLNTIQHVGAPNITVSHTLNNFLSFRPPPPFSGAVGESLANFLDRLNQYMLMQGIDGNGHNDDRFQQAYLENSLTGAALASYKELKKKPNVQDFSRLVVELKKLYPEGRDADLYQQLIFDRKLRHTGSVI